MWFQTLTEICDGAVIVELRELVGLTRSDVKQLSEWLAGDSDTVRMPNQSHPAPVSRSFVVAITTTDLKQLQFDVSDSNKFVVLSLADIESKRGRQKWRHHALNYATENRDKIWAEVKYDYLNQ